MLAGVFIELIANGTPSFVMVYKFILSLKNLMASELSLPLAVEFSSISIMHISFLSPYDKVIPIKGLALCSARKKLKGELETFMASPNCNDAPVVVALTKNACPDGK